jgi:flavin-dependent dehydrogenase
MSHSGAEVGPVLIAGGGVAGCATALALLRRGCTSVTLVDPGPTPGPRVGETLPPDARRLLGLLGVGASFDQQGHAPCHGSTACWGSAERGFNDHFTHPQGHGWHLDRARFDAWLADQAAGATWVRGARVVEVQREGSTWQVTSSAGHTWTAAWLVDATGARSSLGRRLGAHRLEHDRLLYLAHTLAADPSQPRSGQTWLEATPDGWWYAAQLPSGDWTVALATDQARDFTRPETWLDALSQTLHLGPRLAHLRAREAAPQVWAAPSSLLGPPAGPGWLAVGDAAASYDPICARGIHKALTDGLRAASALCGEGDGLAGYAAQTVLSYRAYLQERAWLYALEARWPEAPFWQRRRERRGLRGPGEG